MLHVVEIFNDDGVAVGLANESEHFGVAVFPENHDLRGGFSLCQKLPRGFVLLLDAPLQLQHHGTGGIDDFDVVPTGNFVGLRRFAVGPEQHFRIAERVELLVVDGEKAALVEPFHLLAVVDDVAEAVEDG